LFKSALKLYSSFSSKNTRLYTSIWI